ncbi:MAG: ScyD/ScyE family protein [Bacteroidota bacterium]|nr:ScyD/ScyE family protein [Bacteroidota bacterium]MDP4192836.1 ScyD/ScyE family protein [Bacteroidota bacterium]MDP4197025.1 ScyD/ScyE family protein [Bacteroidota bacterium]
MKHRYVQACLYAAFLFTFIFAACSKDPEAPTESSQTSNTLSKATEWSASVQNNLSKDLLVVAKGLNQPRGLIFGRDGYLYIAESGFGGTISTVGQCEQVPPPVGPYLGGNNGSITKVNWRLSQTRIASNFPSTQTSQAVGGNNTSISDVAYYRGELYALLSGAGCSHGHPEIPNGILRVNKNGTWKLIANISSFLKAHPVANPEADDFEPDGDLYSWVRVGHSLYFIESNHGELDRYDLETGQIERIIDISATQGHIVPTAVVYRNGFFYVGNLTTIPYPAGAAKVLKISRDGSSITTYATGFTTILGLSFDLIGNLYVLETSTSTGQPPFLFPNSGRIKKIDRTNTSNIKEIVSGLNFPTSMRLGPDGNLYVSVSGFNSAPGEGQVLRVKIWQQMLLKQGEIEYDEEF